MIKDRIIFRDFSVPETCVDAGHVHMCTGIHATTKARVWSVLTGIEMKGYIEFEDDRATKKRTRVLFFPTTGLKCLRVARVVIREGDFEELGEVTSQGASGSKVTPNSLRCARGAGHVTTDEEGLKAASGQKYNLGTIR